MKIDMEIKRWITKAMTLREKMNTRYAEKYKAMKVEHRDQKVDKRQQGQQSVESKNNGDSQWQKQ